MPTLEITSLYVPVFGILLVLFTLRVGLYRAKTRISFGDGGDSQFNKTIRAHANFVETAPLTLMLITLVEYNGAEAILVHSLFSLLLISRLSHYLQITEVFKPVIFRMLGMIGTFAAVLIASGWLLFG
jgi:uncharacterized membrane protein YecN with MAPEG domain